ncbi:MAG TPA: radical SAM family heme chaperone HemW [Verrucomicrobiota bacterium]|nr:radical SAM family heme chaperone HemW [Verrucomicrobiota bacterium]HNU50882.1 radical SAM family heme chaperone HemW [Verrucomicrobiota bacterium]
MSRTRLPNPASPPDPRGKPEETTPVRHLYVHVPFCLHKCEYCAFYSTPAPPELYQRYTRALVRELEWVAPDLAPETIYFGGGTPTLLDIREWELVLNAMQRLGLKGASEWTVEANPATITPEKASLLRAAGVNRISLGAQSLDDTLLRRLGRLHDRQQVFHTYDLIRHAGFRNVNLDLMFAIPGQSLDTWRRTLREALALESEHLSSYEVIYEEDTPLYQQLQASEFEVDEDLACDMFDALAASAAQAGLAQYEIANFARHRSPTPAPVPDCACRHNVNTWRGGSFHGLGPSATSCVRGVRARNWPSVERYCADIERGLRPIESTETLPPLSRAGEIAAFGLRMNVGWRFAEFTRITGFDLRIDWAQDMDRLEAEGLGRRHRGGFQLTDRGLRFADLAAERFLRP